MNFTVLNVEHIRAILAIAAANDLFILHVDCTNAFLNGLSDLELYVLQPEGFIDSKHPNKVLRLNKALYGLKQAPRIWYLLLCRVIVGLGFQVLETDTCIYVRGEIIVEVYVDDIKILGPSQQPCYEVYHELCKHFKMQDKGAVKSFLGLNITRNWEEHSISINQPGYIDRLLARFNMINAKTTSTPLEPGCQLLKATQPDKLCDPTRYQELTGSLNHLAVFSCPDISFAVSKLAQFNANPSMTHWKAGYAFFVILKLPEITALLTKDPRFLLEYSATQTQITDPIPTIEYPTPAMFSCATEDQFPGIRINNPPLLIQQRKRNIWHYQMHPEKHLQGSNSAKNSKFAHPHRQLRSFRIINLLSKLPKIQRIIAKPNTSTFGIMPSDTTFETT